MEIEKYPKYTIIMRNYSLKEARAVLQAMEGLEDQFAVEVTMNSAQAMEEIIQLNKDFGAKITVGAGTVLTFSKEIDAINAGAKFILGACEFTREMIAYAKKRDVLTIPGVMTPSEIYKMTEYGADIIKVFPAAVVGPSFFKEVKAPLGKLRLMAVGGVSQTNAHEFFAGQADYLGIGSGAFEKSDIKDLNIEKLHQSLLKLVKNS